MTGPITGALQASTAASSAATSYNLSPANIRRWRAGLNAARAGGSACELWIGDSIFGGCTNINGPVFDRLNAIPRAYERAQAAKGIPTNGTGYIRTYDNTHQDARWALGGWGVSGSGTSIEITASGAVCTLTTNLAGTGLAVLYYDFGTDPLQVSINGAVSGPNFGTIALTGTHTWKRFVMTGATIAAGNAITIKTTSAVLAILAGVEIFSAAGLTVHNLGQSASTAGGAGFSSWSDTSSGYDLLTIFGGAVYAQTPCVIHIGLGYWDYTNGALAAFDAGVRTILAAFPNSDVVLHRCPQPGSATTAGWAAYLTDINALANSLGVGVLDVQALLGGYAIEAANGQTGDTTAHLNTGAYAAWGNAAAGLAA